MIWTGLGLTRHGSLATECVGVQILRKATKGFMIYTFQQKGECVVVRAFCAKQDVWSRDLSRHGADDLLGFLGV